MQHDTIVNELILTVWSTEWLTRWWVNQLINQTINNKILEGNKNVNLGLICYNIVVIY